MAAAYPKPTLEVHLQKKLPAPRKAKRIRGLAEVEEEEQEKSSMKSKYLRKY